MELDNFQRLLISNQYLILERLYPEEASSYANHRKAIECGYTLHYDWAIEHLYPEMPKDRCQFVLEVLKMYRMLLNAFRESGGVDGVEQKDVLFPGFDGNEETDLMSYADYFINDLGRYSEFVQDKRRFYAFNTHTPMSNRYSRMLQAWKASADVHSLTPDEVRAIVNA